MDRRKKERKGKERKGKKRKWTEKKGKESKDRSRTLEITAVPCVREAEAPAPRQSRLNLATDCPKDVFSDLKDGRFDQESVEGHAEKQNKKQNRTK
eukprot:COSAG06_NODE_3068_length_5896_cov_126.296360_1_plen_96_part_00